MNFTETQYTIFTRLVCQKISQLKTEAEENVRISNSMSAALQFVSKAASEARVVTNFLESKLSFMR